MATQIAFTAMLRAGEAVVAKAVVGLPGLAIDPQFGTFPSFTQANEFAQRLNEGLGLSPSETRAIVTGAILTAQALIEECEVLRQRARELRQRRRPPELGCVLTLLELGVTRCKIACTCRDVPKERVLRDASKALSYAMTAMGRFDFAKDGVEQIKAGIDGLQSALEECTVQADRDNELNPMRDDVQDKPRVST